MDGEFDPVSVSGRRFSRAWLAVSAAASDDDEAFALYRRVLVEVFADGVQLVATDGFWLARAWVPFDELTPAPEFDELPSGPAGMSFVAADTDLRLREMMRFVAKATKKNDDDHPDIPVVLHGTVDYDEDRPTLDPTLAAPLVVASIPGERLELRQSEVEFPTWRKLWSDVVKGRESIVFSPRIISKMAAAVNAAGCTAMRFEFQERAVRWSADQIGLDLAGLVMPLRDPNGEDGE